MFIKNYLTKIVKSLLLQEVDVNSNRKSYADRVNNSNASALRISLCSSSQGEFSISQNNQTKYVQLPTTRKKTSSEKLVNKTQRKSIKQIISNILDLVKSKIALPNFKPKKREFTEKDFKLIQNLVEKNKGNFPKSWQEFYQITGTNKNTFNN